MPQTEWLKLSEMLKRLDEQRKRVDAMRDARDRNNGNIVPSEAFRHRDLTPTKPAKLGF